MEEMDLLKGEKLFSKFIYLWEHVYVLEQFCWNIMLPVGNYFFFKISCSMNAVGLKYK